MSTWAYCFDADQQSGGQLEAVRDVDLSKVDASEVEAGNISEEGDTDDAESDEDLDR